MQPLDHLALIQEHNRGMHMQASVTECSVATESRGDTLTVR